MAAALEAEITNFRAALEWSLDSGDPTLALRVVGALPIYWEIRGTGAEGQEWIATALRAVGDEAPILDLARARRAEVNLSVSDGCVYDHEALRRSKTRGDEALALARRSRIR